MDMESASNMASTSAKRHYGIAFVVSLAMSLFFWIEMGVFNVVGFLFWTCLSALLGSSFGLVVGRRILVTVVATFVIRLLLFVIMTWF
ncbi:MAG: hypothetical protein HOE73_02695 [Bacteroidetes Order II. Incertae sedis bacterium]|jgi:hypothetical protein|nr:hypothetical protein [Bacteroidetes Order II. bacterium]MBT4051976.1 hypothetical protein [Bacteroidetes Order II. bacterium]MBT6599472.1 hypothetical protein [Bacteroidetes Order II. bacterium]HAY36223.1 hypothetical protein [Bacteroidota bacterium]